MFNRTKHIIEKVENDLINKLGEAMEISSPPNIKGESYEDSISNFFETYLGSIYDFHTRVSIIDFLGLCFEKFKPTENEFDIVATYKTAVPKILLEHERQKFIPYDSVAFIIQVKQDLDKGKLKSDLEKFRKLRSLPLYPGRVPASVEYPADLHAGGRNELPLSILFYIRKNISDRAMESLLREFKDYWDFLVVVEDKKLLVNYRIVKTLGKSAKENIQTLKGRTTEEIKTSLDEWEKATERELEEVVKKSYMVLGEKEHPLVSLICTIPVIVPYPMVCNSTAFFLVNIFPKSLIFLLGPKFTEVLLEEILRRTKR